VAKRPSASQSAKASASSAPPIFHRKGLAYFWVLNDGSTADQLQPQLEAFAKAKDLSAICIHPRPGLLVPYGSQDWFDLIRELCQRAAKLDVPVWLYDEDPYPSGAASGRVFLERPQYNARHVARFEFDPTIMDADLFAFPPGELLWAGLVPDDGSTASIVDLTHKVGSVRREWRVWEKWDSRWFYPDTPRYTTRRADTKTQEYALFAPKVPKGMKLVAFVSRATNYDWMSWEGLPDTLSAEATKFFIQLTHEKYKKAVGDMFGKEIKAIFTDEPKPHGRQPWTWGFAEDFQARFGYDLRPRLFHLFGDTPNDEACLTRLHYRQYIGERFEQNWLKPVADWCHKNDLQLVGHISPEDDPIEQATTVANLMPLFKHFDLCGIDLIIPAVGDKDHPILSVGCTAAASAQQQYNKSGVMSETGAAGGDEADPKRYERILQWQVMMGVTSPLMHCAHASTRGPRAYEYPPDYGPGSSQWPGMVKLHAKLAALQEVTFDAKQIAPVAIVWPIRTFHERQYEMNNDYTGMRRDFTHTLRTCLDAQVGTHIIDEQGLTDAKIVDGALTLGRARYTHLIVPSATVLGAAALAVLKAASKAGVKVVSVGVRPKRALATLKTAAKPEDRGDAGAVAGHGALVPTELDWLPSVELSALPASLPRLLDLPGDTTDVRVTAWEKGGKTRKLLMNIGEKAYSGKIGAKTIKVKAGEVVVV